MSVKEAEEIAYSWIMIEFNPVKGENMWQNQSQPIETQQDDQQNLQITLQKMINMIDMADDGKQKEMMVNDGR